MLILKRKQNQRIFIHDEATGRRIGCILVTEIDSNVVRLGLSGETLAFVRDDMVKPREDRHDQQPTETRMAGAK